MQWIYGIILNQTQKLNKFIAYTKMETKVEGRKTACDYYKLPTAYHDISIMTPSNICLHFLFYFVCLFVFPFYNF